MSDQPGRPISKEAPGFAGRFAFVVPLVHPNGKKIRDYAVVERSLKETLRSYTRQDYGDVVVVVVCHRAPAWAEEFAGHAQFLELAPHPRFDANVNNVIVDKGVKYVLGSAFAISVENASLIMLADGDDFVRRDLATTVLSRPLEEHDGFIIQQGYNVPIYVTEKTFRILQVLRVRDFDRGCGTCRIFSRTSITRVLEGLNPGILDWSHQLGSADRVIIPVDDLFLSTLWEMVAPGTKEANGTIQVLGRHIRQGSAFDLQPLLEPLAAKACGHGNHDGPRSGGILWSGVRGCANRAAFLDQFGLTGGAVERAGLEPSLWLRGSAFGVVNALRNRLALRSKYEKSHALGLKPPK